jgi:LDH2 family malate/lactate/ureidoglycolate dehydrogenase
VSLADLHRFATAMLVARGVRAAHAIVVADALCYADARGLGTHGVCSLATIYDPRLEDGRIDPVGEPHVVGGRGAVKIVDADGALGHVSMTMATDLAVATAKEHGVAAVGVRQSSHFGAAGYYVDRAARLGLIAVVMTNCGDQGVVPPLGGTRRLLGTNPIAASVPADREPSFILDMATTTTPTGRIAAAQRAGEAIPRGWLVGPDGEDVCDPDAYFDGRADVTWLGGRVETGAAKGYGLAVLVDLLCGPLAGAGWGPRAGALTTPQSADDNVGHFVIVIDPAAFAQSSLFGARVDELLSTIRSSPAAPGRTVTYPGAPEAERLAESARIGVVLPGHLLPRLLELAHTLNVAAPAGLRVDPTGGCGWP